MSIMSSIVTHPRGYVSHSVKEIIKRAEEVLGLKNDSELASFLGIKPNTISGWKKRNRIDYSLLLTKMAGVNIHWLITGEGEPTFETKTPVGKTADAPVVNDVDKLASFGRHNLDNPPNKFGAVDDPLKVIEKMKKIDPERLKIILDLIDLYSEK